MFWLLLCVIISNSNAFIGYDCGSRNLNVTTLSLLEVEECELPETNVDVSKKYVQLLQINEYSETKIIQCKFETHRTVYYCGMHSHISIVLNGENEYINDVSRSACEDVHKTGILKVTESHIVCDIKINQTITHSLMFAGYINSKGKCNGVGYSHPFGTWKNVVVQGTIKISLSEQTPSFIKE